MTDDLDFVSLMSPPLQGTESAAKAIARVSYTHDQIIDWILQNPGASQGDVAKQFGYTQAWLSRVMNSDAFLARVAQRKHDLIDPAIVATIDEKLKAVASRSLDIVLEKLDLPQTLDSALEAGKFAAKALGYGARQTNLSVQTNFVVALPGKIADAAQWAETCKNRVVENGTNS